LIERYSQQREKKQGLGYYHDLTAFLSHIPITIDKTANNACAKNSQNNH